MRKYKNCEVKNVNFEKECQLGAGREGDKIQSGIYVDSRELNVKLELTNHKMMI